MDTSAHINSQAGCGIQHHLEPTSDLHQILKAQGRQGTRSTVCSIYPEYIQHSDSDALCTLHKIVTRVWEEEVIPEE